MKHETEATLSLRIKELEKELDHFKNYDALTGLYNQKAFYQIVSDTLKKNPSLSYEVLCADIEHFKLINDVYGTQLGDLLLVHIAKDLKAAFHEQQMYCCRMGPDVFAIFLPAKHSGEKAAKIIYQIFHAYSNDMEIFPSIGIYRIHDHHTPVSLMCDRARMAANSIKGIYMKYMAYYNDSMRNVLLEEQELLSCADTAIEHGEFVVYMQPKCNMNTGKITGAEALVRWNHPQKGLIPPKDFIPFFEKNGFIKKLDQYVWEQCAKWLHEWSKKHDILPISVNVSRIDIFGLDVQQIFQQLVETYQIDPSWLELEITESAYSTRSDEIILAINHLMSKGFTILMDDFGSGYSSLNILKDINIDVLKLDMRFLDNQDAKSKDIIESVVHMAKWLNLNIIAEGVENKDQIEFLLKVGCHHAQGYYYYKPMPLAEFEKLLENTNLVDYHDPSFETKKDISLISLRDLFHEDMVSENLLNNILGAVAIYRYHDGKLFLQKGNERYDRLQSLKDLDMDILETVHPDDKASYIAAIQQAVDARDDGAEVTLRVYHDDHRMLWLHIRLFFLSETKGDKLFYASLNEVSEAMDSLEALRMSEQCFRSAMLAHNITIFELDIPAKTVHFSQYTQKIFGFPNCYMLAPEGFLEQGSICADDVDCFCAMYDKIYHGAQSASCIVSYHMQDGSTFLSRTTLTAMKDNFGNATKAVGFVEQVTNETEQKELP